MFRSAFEKRGSWYKGNIHTHTTLSDGAVEPLEQIKAYKSHGYNFLVFTDHNVMNIDSSWDSENFIMIPGWERDILYTPKMKCTHVVGLFPAETEDGQISLPPGDKNKMNDQQLIDEMKKYNEFISLAHPTWSRMEPEEILAIDGFDAVEVFNTGTEFLCHEGHAEWVWDMLLRQGRHILGIACDDTHSHTARDDRFCGWIMVNSEELSRKSILKSIKEGNYYSTMGPEIKDWGYDEEKGTFHIECSPVSEIHFVTYPDRGKANFGENLTSMDYQLKGHEKFLRVELIDKNGCRAWTNPWYF